MKWYPSIPSQECVATNAAGFPYEEFSCLYPFLGWTYTRWEIGYDPVSVRDLMLKSPWVPIVACLLYGLFIVAGQAYFSTRPPWNLRKLLAVWNLALSVFSFVGLVRVLPAILHMWATYTRKENFCMDPESSFGSGSTGLWVQLFILSKLPELFDTFFIVVHKKPLIFLHWYHHITVLLFCWHSYVTKSPPGVYFVGMNYAVHALMYFYYFLMAIHRKPKWLGAFWITLAQISQMIVGVAVTLAAFYYYKTEPACNVTADNNTAAFIMYGSYLALFVQFFVQRYFSGKSGSKTAAAMSGAKSRPKVPRRKED